MRFYSSTNLLLKTQSLASYTVRMK
uniref:Uncharacterized protein n=1 Tax=Anguilla anguilla TaxID=7936 RepID=A0A0E9SAC6_ANGAN